MTSATWRGRLGWSLLYGVGVQLPVLVAFIWVARFIAPSDFGTMALAWLIVGVGQVVMLETVGEALVRREDVSAADCDTAFWLCLALGLGFAALTALLAAPAARYFADPLLAQVLPILSLRLIFDGAGVVPDALLRRALEVRTVALRGAAANGLAAAVAIALASMGHGVWALVIQQVLMGAVMAAIAWRVVHYRPGAPRAWPARDVSSHALNASLFRGVGYASVSLDRALVGRLAGNTQLGVYAMALRVQQLMLDLIVSNALRLVALPALAQLGRDAAALRHTYLRAVGIVALAAFPCLAGVGVLAGALVPAVFGQTWQAAASVVPLLMVEGALVSLAMLNSTLLRALGHSREWLWVQSAEFVLGTVLVLAAVRHGIVAVAAAVILKALLVFPLHLRFVMRHCGLGLPQFLLALRAPVAGAVAMITVIAPLQPLLAVAFSPWVLIAISAATGAAVYGIVLALAFGRDVRKIIGVSPRSTLQ